MNIKKPTNEKIQALCTDAAGRAEQWMLNHLEDLYQSDVPDDPMTYYKWPLALYERGETQAAGKLLRWIRDKCLSRNGDLVSNRKGFHKEFHAYANAWVLLAAIKLDEKVLTEKPLGFLLDHYNHTTGGMVTNPALFDHLTEDPLSTSFLGIAACELKDKRLAGQVFNYLRQWVGQPVEQDRLWLRTSPGGSLARKFPPGADPSTWVIELGKKDESYYFLGSVCYFLACYMETFDKGKGLELANMVAGLLEYAGPKALNTIWAAKVAPGCTALYAVTGEERYLDLARPVIGAVLAGQTPEGYWLKNDKPWVTVSAEQCYWLSGIRRKI